MADSDAFRFASEELTRRTPLEAIEIRGTVRIALKQAGLAAATGTPEQMAVVIERLMPAELERRGVEDAELLCSSLVPRVRSLSGGSSSDESPESVFERLGDSS